MSGKGVHKINLGELKPFARTFLEAYRTASITSDEDLQRIMREGGYATFEGGMVELTEQVSTTLSHLVDKGIKLIGPKTANEKALSNLAEQAGQELIRGDHDLEGAITRLIESFSEESASSFEVLLPNYLIQFHDGVRSIAMGRVRAAFTDDISTQLMGAMGETG